MTFMDWGVYLASLPISVTFIINVFGVDIVRSNI